LDWAKLALFLAGLFFGGAIDYLILALRRSEFTPYGLRSGVGGNWILAAIDGSLAAFCFLLYRRLDRQGAAKLGHKQ